MTGIVLVVQDHPALLVHSIGVVEDAGFVALAADGAGKATELLKAHDEIETVFADLDTQGCDDLLSDMRSRRPTVRLILTSTSTSRRSSRVPKGALFFQKPFAPAEIEAALIRAAA